MSANQHADSQSRALSRRRFFDRVADGLYGVALAYLLNQDWYGGGLLAGEKVLATPHDRRRIYWSITDERVKKHEIHRAIEGIRDGSND